MLTTAAFTAISVQLHTFSILPNPMMKQFKIQFGSYLLLMAFLPCSATVAQTPWPFTQQGEQVIFLLGDNNFQYRENSEEALRYLIPTLQQGDFRFLNLEGAFAGGTDDPEKRDIAHKNWRHSNPDQVDALTAAQIDAVGVANNVTYPWQAMLKSLAVLDSAGIRYAGGGNDLEEAHRPVIIEKKGLKVGFMQYAATVFPTNHAAKHNQPGIAAIKVYTAYQPPTNLDKPGQPPYVITWLDEASEARMVSDIKTLKASCDLVIASFHWGVSGETEIIAYQKEVAQAVIDAGADVVMGHGPHRYQKIEVYKERPIFYSLGQAAFDDRRSNRHKRNREGLMVRIAVNDKKLASVSMVPTWREDDNFARLYDPSTGKGKELLGYLKSVNETGAPLKVIGQEIMVIDATGN